MFLFFITCNPCESRIFCRRNEALRTVRAPWRRRTRRGETLCAKALAPWPCFPPSGVLCVRASARCRGGTPCNARRILCRVPTADSACMPCDSAMQVCDNCFEPGHVAARLCDFFRPPSLRPPSLSALPLSLLWSSPLVRLTLLPAHAKVPDGSHVPRVRLAGPRQARLPQHRQDV